jgi:adenylylsulfate kinase-like enzyme
MDSPDYLSCRKEARKRCRSRFIDLHPSHKEVGRRRDQKGPFAKRKLGLLEKVKGIMLPFLFGDLPQIKKDIPPLGSLI